MLKRKQNENTYSIVKMSNVFTFEFRPEGSNRDKLRFVTDKFCLLITKKQVGVQFLKQNPLPIRKG